jgi:hypothetical protein
MTIELLVVGGAKISSEKLCAAVNNSLRINSGYSGCEISVRLAGQPPASRTIRHDCSVKDAGAAFVAPGERPGKSSADGQTAMRVVAVRGKGRNPQAT